MLSPLKPLLCRHDFYWSERHQSDRCRHCGKTQAAEPLPSTGGGGDQDGPHAVTVRETSPTPGHDHARSQPDPAVARPALGLTASTKVLKAQARDRRDALLASIERLAVGQPLSRQETLDTVLGLIEDAHSADPVVFGIDAPSHFAALHQSRG